MTGPQEIRGVPRHSYEPPKEQACVLVCNDEKDRLRVCKTKTHRKAMCTMTVEFAEVRTPPPGYKEGTDQLWLFVRYNVRLRR